METKPDAEQFARLVLWHLAGIRADITDLQAELSTVKNMQLGVPTDQQHELRMNRIKDMTEKLYLDALKGAGLEQKPFSPPQDD